MFRSEVQISDLRVPVTCFDVIVIGSGCAGLNAANRLHHYGKTNIALITENLHSGTSRNTGSDKQTYYKLSLSGDEPDSVHQMARDYFSGQSVDGEHALCEAALSAQCFLRLCDLGVPFPTDRYGEYAGYKTDHDPGRRATSMGPLTSRRMTEALERSVLSKGIPILDHRMAVSLLKNGQKEAVGVVCLNTTDQHFEVFLAEAVVLATGGPSAIYSDSCFPASQYGMSGMAFAAGVHGKNLTEWQYGIASLHPRWVVSGTFMQSLPRFLSTDQAGEDQREFLPDYLSDPGLLLTNLFMKGYQWPFNVDNAITGSSLLDLSVYCETKLNGRRVFLDYSENPLGDRFDFRLLSNEAYTYLKNANALFGKPVDRLLHMNRPAYDFFLSHGVDLTKDRIEVAICSQHCNGGMAINAWWETNVPCLFSVGEAAASHGVCRPGGSALNAGQVGSERAARFIARQPSRKLNPVQLTEQCQEQIASVITLPKKLLGSSSNLRQAFSASTAQMSRFAASVRDPSSIAALYQEVCEKYRHFEQQIRIADPKEAALLFRYRDVLISQMMYLFAMMDYFKQGGRSRGSALYCDADGQLPKARLPEGFRFRLDNRAFAGRVQEVSWNDGCPSVQWRPVHPIPNDDLFFENVWRTYRENENVY